MLLSTIKVQSFSLAQSWQCVKRRASILKDKRLPVQWAFEDLGHFSEMEFFSDFFQIFLILMFDFQVAFGQIVLFEFVCEVLIILKINKFVILIVLLIFRTILLTLNNVQLVFQLLLDRTYTCRMLLPGHEISRQQLCRLVQLCLVRFEDWQWLWWFVEGITNVMSTWFVINRHLLMILMMLMMLMIVIASQFVQQGSPYALYLDDWIVECPHIVNVL